MTTGKTTRPSCVLLDADVIIASHELLIWQWLVKMYRIVVPSVVTHEALFSRGHDGQKFDIDLPARVIQGEVEEIAATAEELMQVYSRFDPWFACTLHGGEAEGLALMLAERVAGAVYCCGDARAIQAMAMLGLGECGMSLESLLAGKKPQGRLEHQFTEADFRRNVILGSENRITGTGLLKGILD